MKTSLPEVEIISVHVPKTAGHTFTQALLEVYNIKEIFFDYPYEPEANLAIIESEIRVIQSHLPVTKYRNLFPNAKTIIWLRNPIERLISHYYFWKSLPLEENNICQRLLKENELNIVQFAELPEMQNYITSFFIKEMELADFSFVGIQSFFEEDLTELSMKMGWAKLKGITIINKNIYPEYEKRKQELLANPRIRSRLEYLNRQDMELYQLALKYRRERRMESRKNKLMDIHIELEKNSIYIEKTQKNQNSNSRRDNKFRLI